MTGRRWELFKIARIGGTREIATTAAIALLALLVFGLAQAQTAEPANQQPASAAAVSGAVVGQMVVGAENDAVKLSFASKGELNYHLSVTQTPPGAVIRIENARFDSLPPKVAIDDGTIESVEFTAIGSDAVISMKFAKPGMGVSAKANDGALDLLVGSSVVTSSDAPKAKAAPVVAEAPVARPAEFSIKSSGNLVSFYTGATPSKIDSFLLSDGLRLVIDLQGVTVPSGQYVSDYTEGPVSKIAMRQSGDSVRCVVEARGFGKFEGYALEKSGEGFNLKLTDKQPEKAAAPVGEAQPQEVVAAAKAAAAKPAPAKAAEAKAADTKGGGMVTELGFHQDEAKSYVDIALSKVAAYEVSEATDKRMVLDIKNTALSKKYERALDASAFSGPIAIIAAYNRGPHTRVVVDLKKAAPFKVEQNDKGVAIVFEGGRDSEPTTQVEEKERIVLVTPEGQKVEATAAAQAAAAPGKEEAKAAPAPDKLGYSGQKISMDFVEADIRNILRIIGDVSGMNIVTGSEVTGKMTIKLVDIPWDQALDVILKAKGLDKEIEGNVMRIVAAERLASERAAKVAAAVASSKAAEDTTPLVSEVLPVSYAQAKDVLENVKAVMSKRGSASIDTRTNIILLRDLPDNVDLAKKLVARLDTPTPQVLIEARIVEVSSTYSKDLGVQWGGAFAADPTRGNAPTNGFPNSIGLKGDTGLSNYAINFPASAGSGGGVGGAFALSLGSINDVLSLDLRLSAMETSGKGRVVSSPRVATLDNKPAEISQGISIPFTTATQEKIETQSIDYLLKLLVTPHVTSDDSIVLKIDLKKDSPSTTFVAVDSSTPAKETRAATTEILVRNGETAVIGGIITDSNSIVEKGVPWFQNLPLIGWMFQSKVDRTDKTELIIFITPRVLRLDVAKNTK